MPHSGETSSGLDIPVLNIFLDKFLLKRELELALENQRWYDLVRTGRFIEELSEVELAYNNATGTAQVVQLNIQPYHKYFPIPQHEIDQSNRAFSSRMMDTSNENIVYSC